jgi:hypothetical protein
MTTGIYVDFDARLCANRLRSLPSDESAASDNVSASEKKRLSIDSYSGCARRPLRNASTAAAASVARHGRITRMTAPSFFARRHESHEVPPPDVTRRWR